MIIEMWNDDVLSKRAKMEAIDPNAIIKVDVHAAFMHTPRSAVTGTVFGMGIKANEYLCCQFCVPHRGARLTEQVAGLIDLFESVTSDKECFFGGCWTIT